MLVDMVSPVACGESQYGASTSPIVDSELAADQLMAMLAIEETYKIPTILCRASTIESDRLPYGEWRRKICQWSFKVIDHFRLDREVVSCAMNIFDRYLAVRTKSFDLDSCPCQACQRSVDSRTFQLTAMTSLYLAIKMYSDNSDEHLSPYRKLRLTSFVELSRGQFSATDITEMESSILRELRWKVHPPTPMTVVSYLLRLMPGRALVPRSCRESYDLVLHVLHELARYLTELSVCLGDVSTNHSPSQIAYAAILVSMDLLTNSALPRSVRVRLNEAVVSASSLSGGTILTPHDEPIRFLQDQLRRSFWPEMLMDDCESAEMGHPISMARDFGLLNLASISSPQSRYFESPKDWEGSPVCVSRGPIAMQE
jgi:hypothetical protein